MSERRIACLLVPLFPLAARLRSEPELLQEAVSVLAGKGKSARVVAATRPARQAGIQAGMTLAQARARLPKLIARPRDAICEQAAQQALLDVAEGFSPRVEDPGEGMAYLDVGGLERLYPGPNPEADLARSLALRMESQAGLPVKMGIAASKLAARVAAGRPGSPTLVAAGEEGAFLAPLPLTGLTTGAATLATLERWGIRSVGEFAAFPPEEVLARLGSGGQALHTIARGRDPQPLVPRQPPPSFREGLELEWPLVNVEPLLFVLRGALERITQRMQGRGLGCSRLELALGLDPEGHHERAIQLPAPTRDVRTLTTLLRLDLEATPPNAPVLTFDLVAHPNQPRQAQLNLFGPAALSPDRLATTLARLFALLGEGRVGTPESPDVHAPAGFSLVPFEPPPPPKEERQTRPGRGLLAARALRPALPLEVLVGEAHRGAAEEIAEPAPAYGRDALPQPATSRDEPPLFLKTLDGEETEKRTRIEGKVKVASGPWGMEQAWWSEEGAERDYWDVELASGGLYRVFRDRRTDAWFADGIYD